MRLVLSTAYTNLNAWINHASRVLDDANAGDNNGHQFYGKFIYTATKLLEMCKINYKCYYFEEHTMHLIQFVIQMNKCTTHLHYRKHQHMAYTHKTVHTVYTTKPAASMYCNYNS